MSSDAAVATVVFTILAIAGAVAIYCWMFARARHLLNKWAADNHYRIIAKSFVRPRILLVWALAFWSIVCHVDVEDEAGVRQRAWIRCRGSWLGLLTDKVRAVWEQDE